MNEPDENGDNTDNYNHHDNDDNGIAFTTNDTTTTTTTINQIDMNDPKQYQLLQRRMLEGKSFRAPSTDTCPDDVYESWRTSFMNQLHDDPKGIAKVFQYVWYDDEDGIDSNTARFGAACDVDQLVKMITTGQIKRDSISYTGPGNVDNKPSRKAWSEIAQLTNVDYRLVKEEIKDNSDNVIETLEPLKDHKIVILDQIAIFLTGGFYKTKYTKNGVVEKGGPLRAYFENYDTIFKALRAAHEEGVNCVPMDMIDSFKDGAYCSYNVVMQAMKRRYNRCQTHETMIDWFKKIDKIVAMKCPMEFKVQRMRTTLKKLYFTGVEPYPECADFPGDKITQMNPDEFTCPMAFLVGYIFMDKHIPRNRWEKVQKEFYHEIEGKVTYKTWNENRLELWRKMDDEIRSKAQSNVARNVNLIDLDGTMVDPNDVNSCINYVKQKQLQKRRQQSNQQPRQRPQQQYYQDNRFNRSSKPKPPPNKQFGTKETIPSRLRKYLCRSCSSWAGCNKYHVGPYGGGPGTKCPYDRNGNKRVDKNGKPFPFIKMIEGVAVENIQMEDYRDIFNINDSNDNLEYEEDVDDQNDNVNYAQAANQMLRDALGQEYPE